MRLAAAGACLALLLQTMVASPLQQQVPAKASIEGSVTRAGTGDPIPGSRVSLTRMGGVLTGATATSPLPPPARIADPFNSQSSSSLVPEGIRTSSNGSTVSVLTDGQGKFAIRDLDPGRYVVSVGANGYAKQDFGLQGIPLNLLSGQTITFGVSLRPAGNISGRIRDNTGQPAVGIQVQVLKPTYNVNGQRSFQSAGSSRSDDRGEYRLFWISPGRYFVLASTGANPTAGALISSPNEMAGDGIAPTFYPGAIDISQAATIDVKPGADIGGVDVIVNRQPSYRIRGRIVDSRSGQNPPVANIALNTPLLTGGSSSATSVVSYDGRDGTFELRDVSPGPHIIRATLPTSSNTVTPANAGTISAASQNVSGQIALNVMSDMDGVVVTLTPGLSVSGRFLLEGPTVPGSQGAGNLTSYRVQLRPSTDGTTALLGTPAYSQPTSADGTFRIDNVTPGEFRVNVAPLLQDVYVKQARFNQNDVLNKPMPFSSADTGTLEILLSPRGGQIDGTVTDERQVGVPNIQAVLIPDRQRDRIDLYKTATTDASGHFTLHGIAPADYHVFAWEAIDPYAYFDPDLMKQFEPNGKPVHIAESAKENVDVRIIPAEP